MFRNFLILCLQLFIAAAIYGQGDTIKLINPSFEDTPKNSVPPRGWYDCGFENETPPDVQPLGTNGFNVNKSPAHGNTYMGLVVRDNETWEAVSQRLSRNLKKGKCYEFTIQLCRSEIYESQSRLTNLQANYVTPAKFRIFGGNAYCGKAELLGETSLVINVRWLEYKFRFEPSDNYSFVTFEAFYNTPTLFPYNGNVLVDNASNIVEVPCVEKPEEPKKEEPLVQNKPKPEAPKPEAPKTNPASEPKPKILTELDASKIKEGQKIKIDKLLFAADSYQIKAESYDVLNELYDFMTNNPNVVVEIGGHTNTIPQDDYCDKLSTSRAKAVADFLIEKGIPESRLQYKGYGKRQPITSDTSQEGRKKNQRVEIKILSVNG